MAKYADGNGLSHAFTVIKNWVTTNFAAITHTHAASEITNAVTGVKGNSETDYRTGNVNLTAANLGAAGVSHTHGSISSGGAITYDTTAASGDKLVISDSSDSSKLKRSGIALGSSTTTFLANNGTWQTPAGTSYSDFTGATASSAGTHGLVPAPARNQDNNVLVGGGTWDSLSDVLVEYAGGSDGILFLGGGDIRLDDSNTLMTPAQSIKLEGIATGAEVNQNAFSNVKVGSTTVAADSKTDTVELVGSNVTLTPDAANDKVTIGITASDVTTALGTTAVARASANASGTAFGAAATKAVDSSIASGSTSTNLPTSAAVASAISTALSDVAGALVYQGAAASASAISGTSYKKGWYWIASAAFTLYTGVTVEAGDMIIAKQDKTSTFANDVDVVQSNIEALTTAEIDALWAAA